MRQQTRRYRMVVTDIDGTLVDLQQTVSAENKRMIRAFQQAGGIVTLATGRMEHAVRHYVEELEIVHPVILYNGGKIVDLRTGQMLFNSRLDREVAARLLNVPQHQWPDTIFYSRGTLWVREITPVIREYMRKDRVECQVWESPDFLLTSEIDKILMIGEDQGFAAVSDALRPIVGSLCDWVKSEPTYLEVLPRSVSKGRALRLLAEHLGIDLQDVIAIGDNLNDLEMIREAGLGVAVDNAHPMLKEHAGYVARSHLEHAVAEVIRKFCLTQE